MVLAVCGSQGRASAIAPHGSWQGPHHVWVIHTCLMHHHDYMGGTHMPVDGIIITCLMASSSHDMMDATCQVPRCAELAREALGRDQCVVIGLQSTGEANLNVASSAESEFNSLVSAPKVSPSCTTPCIALQMIVHFDHLPVMHWPFPDHLLAMY